MGASPDEYRYVESGGEPADEADLVLVSYVGYYGGVVYAM